MYTKLALLPRTKSVLSVAREKRVRQILRNFSTAVEWLDFGNEAGYVNPNGGFNGGTQNQTWSSGEFSKSVQTQIQSWSSNYEQSWKQSPSMSNSNYQGTWHGKNSDYQNGGSSVQSGNAFNCNIDDMIKEFDVFCKQENLKMALTGMESLEKIGYVMDLARLLVLAKLCGEEDAFQEVSALEKAKACVQGKIKALVYHLDVNYVKYYTDLVVEEFDAFCKQGKVKKALYTTDTLTSLSHVLDLTRLLRLAKLCGEAEALDEAKAVHGKIVACSCHLDVSSYHVLMEMYSDCGLVNEALSIFETMPEKNMETWYIIIRYFAKSGLGEDAIDMFTRFKKEGNKPDAQLFRTVFYTCGVLGDVDEGLLHFESMSRDYGIIPSMEDYASIVEMYALPGFLDEALEFVEKMPMEPNADVWETLMNLSRVHGDLELGDRCAEFVDQLDLTRLNKKSREGLLPVKESDVAKESLKKISGIKALQGIKNRTHEFRAGDTNLPENGELFDLLKKLRKHMVELGYVADTKPVLHDIDQESKETALLGHSERIAFARSVLNTAPRKTITMMKNLRVCNDCHNAMKIMADIVGREVIMRDAKRFHHMKNGGCSCKDYW